MSPYKNCVNCGKQNLIDAESKPADPCYSCGKPIGIKVDKKEAPVAEQLHVDDLPEETRNEVIEEAAKDLPPVPPKPDTTGMSVINRNITLHAYYESNKESILRDFDLLGEASMLKRWGISYNGWCSSRYRWRPEQFPPPKLRGKGAKKAPVKARREKKVKAATPTTGTTPESLEDAEDVCADCPVLQAFKGYRLAVKDILGSLKKAKGGRLSE